MLTGTIDNAPNTEQILKTKLFVSPFRKEYLSRPQLVERINAGVKRRLVTIIAPAGYGKSTLMAEWVGQAKLPTAWLSLDRTDGDPITFLKYLIASLQTRQEILGHGILQALNGSNPPSPQTLLIGLMNEIASLPGELVLLLDDFHTVRSQKVIDLLSMLIYDLPQQMHLIISSRAELPFSLARMRAWGEVIELGIDELRFTPQEAALYLQSHLGGLVSADDQQLLGERSEGWVAGLKMAVLSFHPGQDIHRAAEAFSGRDRFITDYLMDEVLAHQSPKIVDFLIKTSILDKLCAPLCAHLTGDEDAQATLEFLDRSGLFLIPLDNTRTWYRYHHLFAELLLHRFQQQKAERVDDAHRLAARWYFNQHMIVEAVEHWLAANDFQLITECLEGIIDEEILAKGKFSTYLGWLDRIPDEYLLNYPKLILYRVFQLWEMQQIEKFRQQLKLVEKLLGPLPTDLSSLDPKIAPYHGILLVIKGVVHCGDYHSQQGMDCFRKALVLLPEGFTFWRVLSMGGYGFCRRVEGDYQEASAYFTQVIDLATRSDNLLLCFMYSIAQVMVYLTAGQLNQALETCKIPLSLDAKEGNTIPFAGLAYQVMGNLLYLSGDLPAAEQHTRRGIELVIRDGDVFTIANGYFNLASIAILQGEPAKALRLMDEMMSTIGALTPPESALVIARAYQAHVWILCNRLAMARAWAAAPGYGQLDVSQFPDVLGRSYFGVYCTIHDPYLFYVEFIRMTLARYELASGNPEKAISILNTLLTGIVQKNRVFFKAQVLILKSIAWLKANEPDSAAATLLEALHLVAPEPYYAIFRCEGKPLLDLLANLSDHLSREPQLDPENARVLIFIREILAGIPSDSMRMKGPAETTPFDLTPREIDVLRWLADGMSYEDTAQQLVISVNTVKTHLKSIYSKMGVANRLQAVNKAKDLGLIDR